jgi:hypothetical protein
MASPLITVSDLATWLGVSIANEDPRAEAVIAAASALVRSFTGRTWVDVPAPDDVKSVAVQVAGRVWTNPPTGVSSQSRGPFSVTYADAGALGMFLSADEKIILGRYKVGRHGLYSIGVTKNDAYSDTIYVPTAPAPSGYPFPWLTSEDL